jgi:hypothetical protein
MQINFVVILLSAIIPLLMGFIWYHPKTFGNPWMKLSDVSEEKLKSGNLGIIMGVSYIFFVLIAFVLQFMVIHQYSVYSILANEPGINDPTSEMGNMLQFFMDKYGNNFRTFKHGAFHGTLAGIFFATPILGVNALFERKGFKYIFLNGAYWIVSLALMGGVICAYA